MKSEIVIIGRDKICREDASLGLPGTGVKEAIDIPNVPRILEAASAQRADEVRRVRFTRSLYSIVPEESGKPLRTELVWELTFDEGP